MAIKQKSISLKRQGSLISNTMYQLDVLQGKELHFSDEMPFAEKIAEHNVVRLKPKKLEVFQINIGKLCNQTCAHCHVDAGPDRKEENMDKETLQICLDIIKKYQIPTVDITGGAPELNPHFKWFVGECRKSGTKVMNRCNLTVIMSNPKYNTLPEFFAENQVHVISSLPYFSQSRTDSQRGDGVFQDSIAALKRLNAVGYGMAGSQLILDLVYNPSGAFLPDDQASLEAEFKRQLSRKFDIQFNNLYAITNLPISRFLDYLIDSNNYENYMAELVNSFNPATLDGLMCRNTLSISWDGYIYDCDFNQMLDLKVAHDITHISDFDLEVLENRNIVVNQHCYGCTAGAGSSCGGEIV